MAKNKPLASDWKAVLSENINQLEKQVHNKITQNNGGFLLYFHFLVLILSVKDPLLLGLFLKDYSICLIEGAG